MRKVYVWVAITRFWVKPLRPDDPPIQDHRLQGVMSIPATKNVHGVPIDHRLNMSTWLLTNSVRRFHMLKNAMIVRGKWDDFVRNCDVSNSPNSQRLKQPPGDWDLSMVPVLLVPKRYDQSGSSASDFWPEHLDVRSHHQDHHWWQGCTPIKLRQLGSKHSPDSIACPSSEAPWGRWTCRKLWFFTKNHPWTLLWEYHGGMMRHTYIYIYTT